MCIIKILKDLFSDINQSNPDSSLDNSDFSEINRSNPGPNSSLDNSDSDPNSIKTWCWEIKLKGGGPDYFAELEFDKSFPGKLEEKVRGFNLEGYSYIRVTPELFPLYEKKRSYDLYINDSNLTAFLNNIRRIELTNIWFYSMVEVEENKLLIEKGYGGRDDYKGVDTKLLRYLVNESDLSLKSWSIYAGGQGYNHQPFAQGNTPDTLLAYLDGNKN